MSKTLNLSKDFLNRFRANGTNELLGAQPSLTWDLLLHFSVSGDLPIWQSFKTKQTELMLVSLSIYLSYTYNLHIHDTVNKKHAQCSEPKSYFNYIYFMKVHSFLTLVRHLALRGCSKFFVANTVSGGCKFQTSQKMLICHN